MVPEPRRRRIARLLRAARRGRLSLEAARYEDFDLVLSESAHGFQAKSLDPLDQTTAVESFLLPRQKELEHWIATPGEGCDRSESRARDLGRALFDAVFVGEILAAWKVRRERAEKEGRTLRLRIKTSDPALSRLPWELLCDGQGRFLAQTEGCAVVRDVEADRAARVVRLTPPLRILVAAAQIPGADELDIERERQLLGEALAPLEKNRTVVSDPYDDATLPGLRQRAQGAAIVHFIGHGGVDSRGVGTLFLKGEDGATDSVDCHRLSAALEGAEGLGLVVLNVCEGARTRSADRFAGLAQSLSRSGIPAVLAMQYRISDRAALSFARHFYGGLSQGLSIAEALTQARRTMKVESPENEWASPALFMRSAVMPPPLSWKWIVGLTGCALLAATIWHFRTPLSERVWRAWREASAPPEDRSAPALRYDTDLSCPSPPGLNLDFVQIPAGSFTMGWSRGKKDERPPHEVHLTQPFCFGKTEVTQRQWKAIMWDNPSSTQGNDLPVDNVSWLKAQEFVAKLNGRDPSRPYSLATEAEWEYAARLGSARRYGFGDDAAELPDFGNCLGTEDGYGGVAPVNAKPPSPWGIYGMHGNVSEWVLDWMSEYPSSDVVDPRGPSDGRLKVRRGGSLATNAASCSATSRFASEPTYKRYDVGLRIVRTPVRRAAPSPN